MQILLTAATEPEIEPFTVAHGNIDVLITGVGVPSTIYHLQKRIHQVDYDLIIQAGIAGSFVNDMEAGSVVLVKKDCFADLGMEENGNFTPVFNTSLTDENEFPFTGGWLINNGDVLKKTPLPQVNAITVNKVSDAALQTKQMLQAYDASIESMEGAALHYVCLQEQIPFVQLRVISNEVGVRDKSKWKIKEAIENLNFELTRLINGLTN